MVQFDGSSLGGKAGRRVVWLGSFILLAVMAGLIALLATRNKARKEDFYSQYVTTPDMRIAAVNANYYRCCDVVSCSCRSAATSETCASFVDNLEETSSCNNGYYCCEYAWDTCSETICTDDSTYYDDSSAYYDDDSAYHGDDWRRQRRLGEQDPAAGEAAPSEASDGEAGAREMTTCRTRTYRCNRHCVDSVQDRECAVACGQCSTPLVAYTYIHSSQRREYQFCAAQTEGGGETSTAPSGATYVESCWQQYSTYWDRSTSCGRDDSACIQAFHGGAEVGGWVVGTYSSANPADVQTGYDPPPYPRKGSYVAGVVLLSIGMAAVLALCAMLSKG